MYIYNLFLYFAANLAIMLCSTIQYRRHFLKFSDIIYYLHSECNWNFLSKEELYLLKSYGLPGSGLPFFCFDLTLGILNDQSDPDILLILGSAPAQASAEYIYLSKEHHIKIRDKDNNTYFVNSSLLQLIESIYCYSTWLEEIENISRISHTPDVQDDSKFDLYYLLRCIDPTAMAKDSIWYQIVDTPLKIPVSLSEFS